METIKDEFISMKDLTHKQLANIVLANITWLKGEGQPALSEHMRDWARYYALCKRPYKPLPEAPKKKVDNPRT